MSLNKVEEEKKPNTLEGPTTFSQFITTNTFFALIAVFLCGLVFNLREIVTPDEFAWVIQSIHFRQAIIERDWPRMVQSAHPGFITMWLGAIGTTVKLWLEPALQSEVNWILQQSWVRPQAGELSNRLFPFLQPSRNALSLAMAGLWTTVFALLKQRVRPLFAFFTVLLLMTDMWIVGLTNILHVDGLLALFCLTALLLVLPRSDMELGFYSRWRYLLVGIAMAGAILSKVPGMLLLAIIPAVLLVQAWFNEENPIRPLAFIFGCLLLTVGFLAPIVFISPIYVFENVFVLTARETNFTSPTFFLGNITEEPGFFFYPLTTLFRQRLIITLGLIYGVFQFARRKSGRNQLFFLSVICGFCLLFWLGLLISDREFARYALPIYLLIALVSTIAFVSFIHKVETSPYRTQTKGYAFFKVVAILLIFGNPFFLRHDPFAFINPLVGGSYISSRLMLAGWGGAQSFTSANLSYTNGSKIFTDNVPATAPFVQNQGQVLLLTPQTAWLVESDDKVILSLEYKQLNPDLWQQISNDSQQSHTMRHIVRSENVVSVERYAALNRAWVYSGFEQWQLDKTLNRYKSTGFSFNNSLKLNEATIIKPNDEFNIYLLLFWETPQPEDGILQFKIVDDAGNVWIQREDPLADIEGRVSSRWTAGRTYLSIHPLPLASDMPPGDFTVQISHFRPDGSLSGVSDGTGQFLGTTASLATLPVTVPSPQPPVALPEDSPQNNQIKAISEFPTTIGQGEFITGRVWVNTISSVNEQLDLRLSLGDETFVFPVSIQNWQDQFVYQIRPTWQVPADFPAGDYPITLNNLDIGTLTVEPRERNFTLPSKPSLGYQFADVLELVAIDWALGDLANIDVIWQGSGTREVDYTTFIHLKDDTGAVIAQSDLQPGKATSQVIQDEVVQFSAEIPLNGLNPADVKSIAIGFYNPVTGQRLSVT
ncbi:MAG: hypothetical protein AAGD96_22015, partial [Chloroflexota bacterium]